jgi:predicted NBD/HSP70 family sugar kinase
MNGTDELMAEMALVWVGGGGDAEGLDWCHQKLKEAVNAEIENRMMQKQSQEK